MPGTLFQHSPARRAVVLVAVAVAYFGVGKLGLSFSQGTTIVSAVWPPSGVALASVVLFGPGVAPAIFAGAVVANATGDSSILSALGIACGNAIAATLGGVLLRRGSLDIALRRVRDVIALAVVGAGIATAVNATIGTGTLWAAHVDHLDGLWANWRVWWLGDLTGVLLAAPVVLLVAHGIRSARGHTRRPARLAEASLLLGALIGITLLVLSSEMTLAFPVFPLIVLAALRFGQPGAVGAALVVSSLGVYATANGHGPFVGGSADSELLRAQVFVGLAAMTGLLVAAMRSEWERAEDALARLAVSEGALAEAQELAHIGSWEWDAGADHVTWSAELHRIFGLEPGTFEGSYEAYLEHIHPDDRQLVDESVRAAFTAAEPFAFEHRTRGHGGDVRILQDRGRVICDEAGTPVRMAGTAQDVTEQRTAEQRLAHQALHDPLTALPNRVLFLDRLEHALTRAGRTDAGLAVYFCDIDDFKSVNDSLGHEAGDELLVALPPRIRQALRPADTVSRFGGDEFLILCEDLGSAAEAIGIAARVIEAFSRPFALRDREHHISTSVGVVFVEAGTATAPEILRDADAAMYRAKANGRARYELFDAHMRAKLVERLEVEADLRRAIAEGELRLVYQPILALDGGLVGAEALVRWQHPRRGLLAPADFIDVAEDSGLIVPLGTWVIEQAVRQAAAWDGLRVAINLSPHQVTRSSVAEVLDRALRAARIDPALIELEITETVLLDEGDGAMNALCELKRLGVRLVLDDFGTGYSSLSHVKRHPIDALKIDREFIDGLGDEGQDTAIVSAVLSMARALGVDVVAEGVETLTQLAWLREHGCGFAQGHLFSPPVAAADLRQSVRDCNGDPIVTI